MNFIRLLKIRIYVLFIILIIGCNKEEITPFSGYFQGTFYYQNQTYFEGINFSGETFNEVASGGAMYQKYPCTVEGIYKIKKDKIIFNPSIYPTEQFDCDYTILLSGDYQIISQSESELAFRKGGNDEMQTYSLQKLTAEP